jgi:hypothetical protein
MCMARPVPLQKVTRTFFLQILNFFEYTRASEVYKKTTSFRLRIIFH